MKWKKWVAVAGAAAVAASVTMSRAEWFPIIPPKTPHGLAPSETLELHAHLFMREGMGWFFRGDFGGPLVAKSWLDKLSSQTNEDSLERSGIGIVVATLYAHPFFVSSLRDSIRKQVALASRFVIQHPGWTLATNADQARRALESGKRVMVLALEGASGILETEADLHEFIDQDGIRIVTLLHLTDDQYGGVAFLKGYRSLTSPLALLRHLFHPAFNDEDGERVAINDHGLTDKGRWMAHELIRRGVWIDLAHASDKAQNELIPMMRQVGWPLLVTHTTLRKYLGAERGISSSQLSELARSGGVIGLLPSEDMLQGTVIAPKDCPANCPSPAACQGGMEALAAQYTEVASVVGAAGVSMGTDFNGGVPHLKPGCVDEPELMDGGFYQIGQVPALWRALSKRSKSVPRNLSDMMERFLSAWGRVKPS